MLLALLASTNWVMAQSPTLSWAKQLSGNTVDVGSSITTDASGNVYTVGRFSGTIDLDPGTSTFNVTSFSTPATDIFISKVNANGDFVWGKAIGESGYDMAYDVAVDGGGNVLVTGSFNGTVDFDPSVSVSSLSSNGGYDCFVLKLDASGNYAWAKNIGSTGSDEGFSIGVDGLGNVLTCGYFFGTVDFDPGAGTTDKTSAGSIDAFVLGLNSTGDFAWVNQLGSTGDDIAYSIAVGSAGNSCVVGSFQGTLAAGMLGSLPVPSGGSNDGYLQTLASSGAVILGGAIMSTSGDDVANSVALDEVNNAVYLTGRYSGSIPFLGYGYGGGYDLFLQRFSIDPTTKGLTGSPGWGYGIGAGGNQEGTSVSVDSITGSVFLGGYIKGTANDFDPSSNNTYLSGTASSQDGFVAGYNKNGGFLFAFTLGNANYDIVGAVQASDMNVYATGFFQGTLDFDPNGTLNLNSGVSGTVFDAYAVKYSTCTAPSAPVDVTPSANHIICAGNTSALSVTATGTVSWYTAATGGTYLGSGTSFTTPVLNGSVTYYAQDSTCRSGVRVPVVVAVNSIPNVQATASDTSICLGDTITLQGVGAVLNIWDNGVFNGVPFSPTSTANYMLIGSSNGCADTAYVTVTVTSVASPSTPSTFVPLTLTGFNNDIVANGTNYLTSTTTSVDADVDGCRFIDVTYTQFGAPSRYLPTGGAFNSESTPDVPFQFASYTANNALTLFASGDTGTLTLTSPMSMNQFYFLATSGGGMSNVNLEINFTDGTTQSGINLNIDDWFNASNYALRGVGRMYNNALGFQAPGDVNPRIYQYLVNIDPANKSKEVLSVTFTRINLGPMKVQIMGMTAGISMQEFCVSDNPTVLFLSATGNNLQWYNSSNVLLADSTVLQNGQTYNVTQSSNGCPSQPASVVVSLLASPNVIVPSATICEGSSVQLTASGADSYEWYSGATTASITVSPSTTTVYNLTGYNTAGCFTDVEVNVTVNPSPTVTVTANPADATVCAGGQVTLSGSGATTYSWDNGVTNNTAFTPSTSGSYNVTGTDTNGCTNTASTSVTVNDLPIVTASTDADTLCVGSTATLTADGADTYSWNTGGTTEVITVAPTVTTIYTVTGTDVNGCQDVATLTQLVATCGAVGVDQLSGDDNQIGVYPNPNNGKFVVTAGIQAASISVTDILGNEIFFVKSSGEATSIDLSSHANGMYFVRVRANGVQTVKRVIKNN